MATTMIHCPHCAVQLSVPSEAVGRKGKCPFCKEKFVVPGEPDPGDLNEDLISDWLSDGIDEEEDAEYGGRLGETLRDKDEAAASGASAGDEGVAEEASEAASSSNRLGGGDGASPMDAVDQMLEQHGGAASEGDGAHEESDSRPRQEAATDEAVAEPDAEAPEADAAHPSPPAQDDSAEGTGRDRKYRYKVESALRPHEVDEEEQQRQKAALHEQAMERRRRREAGSSSAVKTAADRPLLSVLESDATAVTFGFVAKWLSQVGFRASMPIRCASCGEQERRGMVARPLGWPGRGHQSDIPPGELEHRYEVDIRHDHTPRQVVEQMPVIEELRSPFNQPFPAYLCRSCAISGHVTCTAVDSPDGVMCEVVITHAGTALEWLARVNGVCGEEYEALERAVAEMDDDAWRVLAPEVRQRLMVWFRPREAEQFITYVNDADFGRKDAGLAGVVMTNRRLVFGKYHRHRAVELDAPETTLLAERNGPFYDLRCGKRKMVRLRRDDLQSLQRELEEFGKELAIHD